LGGEGEVDGHDELLTIAEISIGLAGFSGVIAVFIQRGGLPLADRLRFLALFVTAFTALVLAFLPIVLAYSGFKDQDIWQISSGTMVLIGFVALLTYPFAVRTIRKEIEETSLLPHVLFLVPAGVHLVVQLANAGGWIWQPNFVPYLIGMLFYLYAAGLFFVIIVLFRPTS
jgi:hypothetical protein